MSISSIQQNTPAFYHSFVGGALAYLLELATLGQLLDRVKTEQEAFPQLRGISAVTRSIYQKGGIQAFYSGIMPNLFLSSTKGAFGWTINNGCYRLMIRLSSKGSEKKYPYLFAGLLGVSSALVESVCLIAPLERVKTVQMTSSKSLKEHLKLEGPLFFVRGLKRVFLRQSVSWVTYLVFYQKIKNTLIKNPQHPVMLWKKIQIGAITGAAVSLIVSPLDFLKTQAQKATFSVAEQMPNVYHLYKKYGIRAFYSNLKIKMIRTSWSSVVVVIVLDYFQALPGSMGFNYGNH